MSRAIATFFWIGCLPGAPGTWGALAALPVAWAIYVTAGLWAFLVATVVVTLIGWWATVEETRTGDPDPSEIVIDEVAGQWIALWPVLIGAAHAGADPLRLWPGWLAAFVLFRLFDIWKPGPVRWADRMHTPWGIMLDDVLAGILAAIGVAALAALAHGVLGI
ncbi:MAG: phosphatidylglycerophosphatase A [Pseudomonadota bacterium]